MTMRANCSTSDLPFHASGIDTAAAIWSDMDSEDKLEIILSWPNPLDWTHPESLDTLAYFRPIPDIWLRVTTRYKAIGGFPPALEKAVDFVLKTECKNSSLHAAAESKPRLATIALSTVTPEAVQWIWWPYLACGTLAMLDGDPGVGKSLLTLQIAAILSTGQCFPDQQGNMTLPSHGPATTLFFAREDSLAHTVRPRLDYMQADLTRIHYVQGVTRSSGVVQAFSLDDLPALVLLC